LKQLVVAVIQITKGVDLFNCNGSTGGNDN